MLLGTLGATWLGDRLVVLAEGIIRATDGDIKACRGVIWAD